MTAPNPKFKRATAPNPKFKSAMEAVRSAEEEGRTVVGVEITRDGFRLDFAPPQDKVGQADLVNMSAK